MKIIISERQLRQIIESENKISDKKLKMYKETIDELGVDMAVVMLNKELWEFIEMGLIESYDGDLNLTYIPIKSLGNLKKVGGELNLRNTDIETLGSLEEVGGELLLNNIPIESLGNLKSVGDNLNLRYTPIKSLGNLKSVGGYLDLSNSKIEILGNLESVGGYLSLKRTPLGEILKSKMSIDEIKNKFGVKGNLYL